MFINFNGMKKPYPSRLPGLLLAQLLFIFLPTILVSAQDTNEQFWRISSRNSIVWDANEMSHSLPHEDNIEMAGSKVAGIISYSIDENQQLSLSRDIIFPQLRIYNKSTDPDWKKYRAYFRHTFEDDILPRISIDEKTLVPGKIDSVEIEGVLKFYHAAVSGIAIERILLPSMRERVFLESWVLKNISDKAKEVTIGNTTYKTQEEGYKGIYHLKSYTDAASQIILAPGEETSLGVYMVAGIDDETIDGFDAKTIIDQRAVFLSKMKSSLILKTPNETLNTLFYFSKIRASESIFYSDKMGYIHSPGGGNYYLGIWANDQVEYSGPFFPYLDYDRGKEAAFNTYNWFSKNIPTDDSHIPYAFEIEGNFIMDHLDRGDAAMIAYGTSQFLLKSGDVEAAQKLWPLIEWSLDYCDNNRNAEGAVLSESDEMEGRIATGDANLATSTLYYGGLKLARILANELGHNNLASTYSRRRAEMEKVIEDYFGSTIEGLDTYKYFDTNTHLRHWICLPLVMGIDTRLNGTREALLSKLWTDNGILVELNPDSEDADVFWDRGTLYAFRGIFKAGELDQSLDRLMAYSEKRLLGERVPYVVEAYPENDMRHLSAESALYCRIFIEGLLGLEHTGFSSYKIKAQLPDDFDFLDLDKLGLADAQFDISLKRQKNKIKVQVVSDSKVLVSKLVKPGEYVTVNY